MPDRCRPVHFLTSRKSPCIRCRSVERCLHIKYQQLAIRGLKVQHYSNRSSTRGTVIITLVYRNPNTGTITTRLAIQLRSLIRYRN